MDTPTPNRKRYTFSIGSDENDQFIERCCELLTEYTGGLTVLTAEGIWREDGNGSLPYTAPMVTEDATVLTFVVDEVNDLGLGAYKDLIRMAQTETDAPVTWVNTEVEPVYCDHFRADMPAVGERHSGDGHMREPSFG